MDREICIGDYVKCITGCITLTVGEYYQVKDIDVDVDSKYSIYSVITNEGATRCYYAWRFEYSESYNRKKKLENLELLYG